MLDKAKTFLGYTLDSVDEEIGRIREFYFDDRHWVIRYVVADTGSWLAGRQVLISPDALDAVSREQQRIVLGLTKREIEEQPSLNLDQPVAPQLGAAWDGQLRSTRDVNRFYVQATDGEMGHVEDVIIDDDAWVIRYLVINTQNWGPGKRILISPQWIERMTWDHGAMFVGLSGQTIRQSPEFTERTLIARDYERQLYRYHNRRGYWTDEPRTSEWGARESA